MRLRVSRSGARPERVDARLWAGTGLPAVIAAVLLASGCQPQLVVGTWACPVPDAGQLMSIDVPWTTGFETGFCDYARAGGLCFADADASYQIVDTPVHGGGHAAAFSLTSDPSKAGTQARCYLQGALPPAALYGAWFYVPAPAKNTGNWNLVHFQGGTPSAWHTLWDVSVVTATDGSLSLYLYDNLTASVRMPDVTRPLPIGSWVHVELRLVRAKDATGEVALYQDGTLLLERTGLVTDDSDLGQWYVGDLTSSLTPPDSTLYVDDVTIRAAP